MPADDGQTILPPKTTEQKQQHPQQAVEPAVEEIKVECHVGILAVLGAQPLVIVGVAIGTKVNRLVVFAKSGPGQNVMYLKPRLPTTFFASTEFHDYLA
jgi:hypothetical protein